FWGFYCGGWLVWVIVFLLMFAASRFALYSGLAFDSSPIAWIVYVLRLAYLIVSSVGVWRSAESYWTAPDGNGRLLGGAARTIVVIWIAVAARGLLDLL